MSANDPKRTFSDAIQSHLIGSGRVAQALETLRNGRVSSRYVALGDPGCEHVFKIIHDNLPVPFRAMLRNAAFKHRLGQKHLPLTGGSVGQLPPLKG
jgi:hypothetical protein